MNEILTYDLLEKACTSSEGDINYETMEQIRSQIKNLGIRPELIPTPPQEMIPVYNVVPTYLLAQDKN